MRKNKCFSTIAVSLSIAMAISGVDVYALNSDTSETRVTYVTENLRSDDAQDDLEDVASDIETVNSALKDYISAVNTTFFPSSSDPSLLSVAGLVGRGLPAAGLVCAGTISILEAVGVVKSPTSEGISAIQDGIKDLDSKMDRLEDEVKNVSEELKKASKIEKEKTRQEGATAFLKSWYDFNTNYVDKMNEMIRVIPSYTTDGVADWWKKAERDNIAVIYSIPSGSEKATIAYSKNSYLKTKDGNIPEKTEANEDVLSEYSFVFYGENLPDTSSVTFNSDTYFTKFSTEIGKEAVKTAFNNHQVKASDSFIAKWDSLSDEEKDAKAIEYAGDILKTVIYQESCRVISEKNDDIEKYIEAYINYCKNIKLEKSGVDAFIQNLYLTHGFEGQVKKDIINFCNTQLKNVGTYGLIIMTAANQSDKITISEQQELQNVWAETIEYVSKKRNNSLTGYDDFCYITGTRVSYESGVAGSIYGNIKNKVTYTSYFDEGYVLAESHHDGWTEGTISRGQMLSEQDVQVLYDQFVHNTDGAKDFLSYLNNAGISVPASGDVDIATDINKSPVPFDLNKGLKMKGCSQLDTHYISCAIKDYTVNKISGLEDKYFTIHDELLYDRVNLNNVAAGCYDDEILLARALFGESHKYWSWDEMLIFWQGDGHYKVENDKNNDNIAKIFNCLTTEFKYLKKTPVAALSKLGIGDIYLEESDDVSNPEAENDIDESSPLVVFGAPYIFEDEPDDESIPYSKADWSTLRWNNINLITDDQYDGTDNKNIEEKITGVIDKAVEDAKMDGISVALSDAEKKVLVSRMYDVVINTEDELKTNNSTDIIDVFSIDEDAVLEKKLAEKTLPAIYFVDGECIIPPENMTVVCEYEPNVFIRFVEKEGKTEPVINTGYEIFPTLVVWDTISESFEGYRISEDVYRNLGIEMVVNIPVGNTKAKGSIGVSCYYSIDNPGQPLDKKLAILGEDEHRYITLQVKNNMLYELREDRLAISDGVWVEDIEDQKYTGKAVKPKISVYDGEKKLTEKTDYSVQLKNNINPGTASATIKGNGDYSFEINTSFIIESPDIRGREFSADDIEIEEKTNAVVKLLWNNKALSNKYYTCKYYKADENYNKVGEAISFDKTAGKYVIEISGANGFSGTRVIKLTVIANTQKLISKLKVDKIRNIDYNEGKAIEPAIVIYDGKHILTGEEYSVKYKNNTEVGTGVAIITGKGKYFGTKKVSFKIVGKPIGKAVVSGVPSSITYTGGSISLNGIKLSYDGKELDNSNYAVKYQNNVNAGKATVLISGLKGYTGTIKKYFKILPYNAADTSNKINVTLAGKSSVEHSKGGAKISVSANFITADGLVVELTEGKDYTLSYSANKAVNTASNASKAPCVTVKFKGNYKGQIKKNFAITSKNIIKTTVVCVDKVFNDKKGAYTTNVVIYDTDGKKLTKNSDYTSEIEYYIGENKLTSDSIVPAGTNVKVLVKAKQGGNYTGEVWGSYYVANNSIGSAIVEADDITYTGSPVSISGNNLKVRTKSGETLYENKDFVILSDGYSNNIRTGKATGTIKGIGNYCGTKKFTFNIRKKGLR